MKRLTIGVVVLGLVVGVVTGLACGGSDREPTVDDYFRRLQAVVDDSQDRIDALRAERVERYAAGDIASTSQDFYKAFAVIMGDLLDDLDKLDAPEEVQDAHNELVDAEAESLDILLTYIIPRLGTVESSADMEALFTQDDFVEAGERFRSACLALQGFADANGIKVDLSCPE